MKAWRCRGKLLAEARHGSVEAGSWHEALSGCKLLAEWRQATSGYSYLLRRQGVVESSYHGRGKERHGVEVRQSRGKPLALGEVQRQAPTMAELRQGEEDWQGKVEASTRHGRVEVTTWHGRVETSPWHGQSRGKPLARAE